MTKLLFITMLYLSTGQNLAQKIPQNGIYQTATDFLTRKLTNGFFSSKINKLNDNNKSIRIEREDKSTVYESSEIWGFRKNGKDKKQEHCLCLMPFPLFPLFLRTYGSRRASSPGLGARPASRVSG